MSRLPGKVAIITGGGSGMGRAGALRFAKEGASVVVADINEDAARQVVEAIEQEGGSAIAVRVDVSDESSVQQMVDSATEAFGRLDIVWANAGISHQWAPIDELSVEVFDRQMAVNARGPWLTARAAIPALKAAGGGSIVITSSLSGIRARPYLSPYQAAKAAAAMLAKSLSIEFAEHKVRVNALCPSAVDTPMLPEFVVGRDDPAAAIQGMVDSVPLGRVATPDDVVAAALFLASDEASFITGVVLPVDGGTFAG